MSASLQLGPAQAVQLPSPLQKLRMCCYQLLDQLRASSLYLQVQLKALSVGRLECPKGL